MTQSMLDYVFQEKSVSQKREAYRPSSLFDRGLADWVEKRSDDLWNKPAGFYDYFGNEFSIRITTANRNFTQSEKARAEIRSGADPEDLLIDAANTHPGRYLESSAIWLGWRLVPYAKKFAEDLRQPDFAFKVEQSVRAWLVKADVVWEMLETLPDSRKNRESFAAWIRPLQEDLNRIKNATLGWVERNT